MQPETKTPPYTDPSVPEILATRDGLYAGRAACGCIRALTGHVDDDPERTIDHLSGLLRDGMRIEWMDRETAIALFRLDCPHASEEAEATNA